MLTDHLRFLVSFFFMVSSICFLEITCAPTTSTKATDVSLTPTLRGQTYTNNCRDRFKTTTALSFKTDRPSGSHQHYKRLPDISSRIVDSNTFDGILDAIKTGTQHGRALAAYHAATVNPPKRGIFKSTRSRAQSRATTRVQTLEDRFAGIKEDTLGAGVTKPLRGKVMDLVFKKASEKAFIQSYQKGSTSEATAALKSTLKGIEAARI